MDDTMVEAPQRFLEITFPDAKSLVEVEPLTEPIGKPRQLVHTLNDDPADWYGWLARQHSRREPPRLHDLPRRALRPRVRVRRSHGGQAGHRRPATRAGARSGDSGDDGPGSSPPPELRFWRHPCYGSCTPKLLRPYSGVAV